MRSTSHGEKSTHCRTTTWPWWGANGGLWGVNGEERRTLFTLHCAGRFAPSLPGKRCRCWSENRQDLASCSLCWLGLEKKQNGATPGGFKGGGTILACGRTYALCYPQVMGIFQRKPEKP